MSKDKKLLPFKYDWLKLVMALNQKKFGHSKSAAYWIIDHMFGDSVICNPGIDTFMRDADCSRSMAIRAINLLVEEGWLGRLEGGGTTASGSGISSTYWLLIPCHRWNCMDVATVSKFHAYSVKLAGQQCQKEGATVSWVTLESTLNLSLKQRSKQDASAGQIDGKMGRDLIQSPSLDPSNETERESEPYFEASSTSPMDTARAIVLPVATAEQRGAWGDAWPAEDKVMRRIQDWDTAYKLVGNEAVRVLNISTEEDARMPEGSEHRYMDTHINATLSDKHRRALATSLQRGDLRYVEMASVLAHYGFKPRAEERREAKREAQS